MAATVDSLIDLSLLDYLTYKAGCLFPSDLRYAKKYTIRRVVERTPAEAFSMKNWMDAIQYITGSCPLLPLEFREEAKQILLERLDVTCR